MRKTLLELEPNNERDVRVLFANGRGAANWNSRYERGEVPDRWPYGLDRIQAANVNVAAVEVQPLRPLALARSLIASRPVAGAPVAISWEENLALRMAAQYPSSVHMSGIIWATDRIATGERRTVDKVIARVLSQCSMLWCLSRPQVSLVENWLGLSAPPVRFLQFGVDENFFAPSPYPDHPFVFSAGSDRDRDTPMLFRALEKIRSSIPGVTIVVQSNSDLPAPDGVTKLQSLSHAEIRDYYAQASVVLVATKQNVHVSGMTVALEAMSASRPVVVCGTPGMSDYVLDSETGRVVPVGDSSAMADAAIEYLLDRSFAEQVGRAARARVERSLTTRRMAAELSGWVEELS